MDNLRNLININEHHHHQHNQNHLHQHQPHQQYQSNLRLRQQQQQQYSEIQNFLAKKREKKLIEKTNKYFQSKSLFAFFKYNNQRLAADEQQSSVPRLKRVIRSPPHLSGNRDTRGDIEDADESESNSNDLVIKRANSKNNCLGDEPDNKMINSNALLINSANSQTNLSFDFSRSNVFSNETSNSNSNYQQPRPPYVSTTGVLSSNKTAGLLSSKLKSANSSTTITTTTNNNNNYTNNSTSRFFSESLNSIISGNSSVMQPIDIRLLYLQASLERDQINRNKSDQHELSQRDQSVLGESREDLHQDFTTFYVQKMRDFGFEGYSNNAKLSNQPDNNKSNRLARKVPVSSVLANKTNFQGLTSHGPRLQPIKSQSPNHTLRHSIQENRRTFDRDENEDNDTEAAQIKKKRNTRLNLSKNIELTNDGAKVQSNPSKTATTDLQDLEFVDLERSVAVSESEEDTNQEKQTLKLKPIRKHVSNSSVHNSNKNAPFSASKFYSTSLITLPEIDEFQTSTLNSDKDFSKLASSILGSSNMKMSSLKQNKVAPNSVSRASRSSITELPPIVEAHVSGNYSKKSNTSTRVDSGIGGDSEQNRNRWNLTPNSSSDNTNDKLNTTVTTIEVMDQPTNNASIKKNITSSTLNSYGGKSSSIQSKLTNTTNNTASSKQSQHSAEPAKPAKITATLPKTTNHNASGSNNEKSTPATNTPNNELGTVTTTTPSNLYNGQNILSYLANANDPAIPSKATTNPASVNANNNNSALNGLHRSVVNRKDTSAIISVNGSDGAPMLTGRAPAPNVDNSSLNRTALLRQNTFHTNVTNVNRQNSIKPIAGNSFNITAKKNERRMTTSLQRQSTTVGETNNYSTASNQSYAIQALNGTKHGNTMQLARNQSQTGKGLVRPKTSVNRQVSRNTVGIQPGKSSNNLLSKTNSTNQLANTSKSNAANAQPPANSNVLDNNQAETGLSEYTMTRILKWLEDIESAQNTSKPSSQQTTLSGRHERPGHVTDDFEQMNDDYNLSDYDSLDEQLLEYNRVVDKTFHIVHDE